MSRTLAVVPFRGKPSAKSRLSTLFSARQREQVARHVLEHVLTVIGESGVVDHLLVVTSDDDGPVISRALPHRTTVLRQPPGSRGLNAAIDLGREWAMSRGYARLLTVLPDLPLLAPDDVRRMVRDDAAVVLAPDRHGTGTNALGIRLASACGQVTSPFAFGFGEQSARHHSHEARRLGIELVTVVATGLQLDLDTPDDWALLPRPVQAALLGDREDSAAS